MSKTFTTKKLRKMGLAAAAVVASVGMMGFNAGTVAAAPSQGQGQSQSQGQGAQGQPPAKAAGPAEEARGREVPNEKVVREAKPMPAPKGRAVGVNNGTAERPSEVPQGPTGPLERVDGAAPVKAPAPEGQGSLSGTAAGGNDQSYSSNGTWQNSAWGGAYYNNPNLQVGKLFFDVQPGPGERWSWCTATATNSENKSLVVTAGHCVYTPDPDGDGRITGNGYWHEHIRFCPGYEYGCRFGTWYYTNVSTTWSWHGGVNGYYDMRDDVAVVKLAANQNGRLVDYVGGHGISFNEATNQYRHAFGYPASDSRWPNYSYSGEDLIYCGGNSYNDGTYVGTMWMNCTMTGGSSGGPWLTNVRSDWMGYVNSVNSHKPYGGAWMSGPYFDSQESSLFNYWRNR